MMRIPFPFTRSTRPAASVLCGVLCLAAGGCVNLRDWTGEPPPPGGEPQLLEVDSREYTLLSEQEVVGSLYTLTLRDGDTLPDVARNYGLGYHDIVVANPGIDPWVPAGGSRVLLPLGHVLPDAPREGIVLNLANMRLFYYPGQAPASIVYSYPAGIGQEGWETPLGRTEIVSKRARPSWYPPESIRREHAAAGDPLPAVVPPGPDNPLGDYALRLGIPSYLIHGTNKPYGVGMRVSHGCVRLYPEDIEPLFNAVAVGVPVRIVDQPYLVGWRDGLLYLEAHDPTEAAEAHALELKTEVLARLEQQAQEQGLALDQERIEEVLSRADGIPTPVLVGSPDLDQLVAGAPAVAHPGRFHGQPEPPLLEPDAWSIAVAAFDDEVQAQRLAAMLNHEGPPIPARSLRGDEQYVVIAGPFPDGDEARAAAARIQRDFEFDAQPLPPELGNGGVGVAAQ